MNKIIITGSTQTICSEQVLLTGAFFSTSVAREFVRGTLRAFVIRALDKISRARTNYPRALLSMLRAVAFCMRVFVVKFKSGGTVCM